MRNLKHLQQFKGSPKKKQGGFIGSALLLAISAYGQYASGEEAKNTANDQAAARRRSEEASRRGAEVQAQRERLKQMREARIQRARILQQTVGEGMGVGTSGVAGAVSSITSQEFSNIGSINVAQGFAQQASVANQQASDAAGRIQSAQATAQQWQTIGNFSGSLFSARGGWQSLFGGSEVKPAQSSRTMGTTEANNLYNSFK